MVRNMVKKIGRYLFSSKTMVFYDFSYDNFVYRHEPPNEFIFRELQPDDYSKFSTFLNFQREAEAVFKPIFTLDDTVARLSNGEYCYICECDDKIIGYVWFAVDRKYIVEIQSTLHLGPTEVYMYNGYVLKEARRHNIVSRLLDVGRKGLIARGFTREITATMSWNYPAAGVLMKSNFKVVGRATMGFFLTRRYMISTCKGMTLVNESSPFEFYMKLRRKLTTMFDD